MTLEVKRIIIAVLGIAFLASLLFVQWMEIVRKQEELGIRPHIEVPADMKRCIECHRQKSPGIVSHWEGSTHAAKGVTCIECHKAEADDIDGFDHEGYHIATLVTPRDCGRCHEEELAEFSASHHAAAGNILASLDNFLAEVAEGGRAGQVTTFSPHSPTPGMNVTEVNGLAAAHTGCQQCHGSKVSFQRKGGGMIDVTDLTVNVINTTAEELGWIGEQLGHAAEVKIQLTGAERQSIKKQFALSPSRKNDLSQEEIAVIEKHLGHPLKDKTLLTDKETKKLNKIKLDAIEPLIVRGKEDKPLFHSGTWPNTGIGRLNLDGSRGSCSACHSRHDFSPRRARQPENCGKCHLGPDHPQKEIYEESKHGIAYRDLKDKMNLDADDWVLGEDYFDAPTCATCHLSANTIDKKITHDPGKRISWTNRPPVSLRMDTNMHGSVLKTTDPELRKALLAEKGAETSDVKRKRMSNVCSHCHTPDYIKGFYKQYDDFVVLYNEKFAKPGGAIMGELLKQGLRTKTPFDDEIEWTWFYLWHHEGRRARHGASMMAPDYAHWHGTYEVAERFYTHLIPQAREIIAHARAEGKEAEAKAVEDVVESILARSEHQWFEKDKKAAP